MSKLAGKTALVTGSSRGIGAAIVRLFARHGARVAVHGRDKRAVSAVCHEIHREGGLAIDVIGDVSRFDDIERMRSGIERELGPVDILVANAGGNYAKPGAIEDTTEADWRGTVDGNLTATFLTIKSFLPGMKARRSGCILTISSAAARRPDARSPVAYAAAKAGIQMLTQDVAAQAGAHDIRVNCIAPETILTERNLERIPAEAQKSMAENHPIKRLGTPDDVARAALFLASEEAAWITGVVLDVAGGSVLV